MAKEAKIGIGVIAVLLMVFGAVLYLRLRGGEETLIEAAAAEQSPQGTKADGLAPNGHAHHVQKPATEKNAMAASSVAPNTITKPTVLKAAASTSKPSAASSTGTPQWSMATDRTSVPKVPQAPPQLDLQPSYMPAPPRPKAADPYSRYGSQQNAPTAVRPWNPTDPDPSGVDSRSPQNYDPQTQLQLSIPSSPDSTGSADARQDASMRRHVPDDSSAGYRDVASSNRHDFAQNARPGATSLPSTNSYRSSAYSRASDTRPSSSSAYAPPSAYASDRYPGGASRRTTIPDYPVRTGRSENALRQIDATPTAARVAPAPITVDDVRTEDGQYVIQPNDSYWKISERLYGCGAYFKALAEHNRERFPQQNRLEVGATLSAPNREELEKDYPGLCPKADHRDAMINRMQTVSTRAGYGGRKYTVEEGDTLYDIARYELGQASRWAEIYDMNRDVIGKDYHLLAPGMQLVLPEDEPTETLTRTPGDSSTYRR